MSLDDAFAAIRAGTLSRLALPDAYSTSATYVTAHTALYQNGLISQVPHDIYAGTIGPGGDFPTPFGTVRLRQFESAMFCGWGGQKRGADRNRRKGHCRLFLPRLWAAARGRGSVRVALGNRARVR